jgi:N-ethylmaleimide reductase
MAHRSTGAHGYIIDQFLRDGANDRTDDYGGSLENRARLLLDIVDATASVLGADRISVRISPLVPFNDMVDADPEALVEYVARELDRRKIAFLELRHNDFRDPAEQRLAQIARREFHGPLFVNGGYDQAQRASGCRQRFGRRRGVRQGVFVQSGSGRALSRRRATQPGRFRQAVHAGTGRFTPTIQAWRNELRLRVL